MSIVSDLMALKLGFFMKKSSFRLFFENLFFCVFCLHIAPPSGVFSIKLKKKVKIATFSGESGVSSLDLFQRMNKMKFRLSV